MANYLDREILIQRGDKWIALEGDYWFVMLRLIKIYGHNDEVYTPPAPGKRNYTDATAMQTLLDCISKAADDLPNDDLWRFHGNDPDPVTTSPHEFFSGIGVSYFETLLNFVGAGEVFIEVSEPGTEYRFLGESSRRPGP